MFVREGQGRVVNVISNQRQSTQRRRDFEQ